MLPPSSDKKLGQPQISRLISTFTLGTKSPLPRVIIILKTQCDNYFCTRREMRIFLFTTASTTALGPTQPPIQWVLGALSLGVKRPGHEADHSPPSSAEVKE
jgi:hypothetical protein